MLLNFKLASLLLVTPTYILVSPIYWHVDKKAAWSSISINDIRKLFSEEKDNTSITKSALLTWLQFILPDTQSVTSSSQNGLISVQSNQFRTNMYWFNRERCVHVWRPWFQWFCNITIGGIRCCSLCWVGDTVCFLSSLFIVARLWKVKNKPMTTAFLSFTPYIYPEQFYALTNSSQCAEVKFVRRNQSQSRIFTTLCCVDFCCERKRSSFS